MLDLFAEHGKVIQDDFGGDSFTGARFSRYQNGLVGGEVVEAAGAVTGGSPAIAVIIIAAAVHEDGVFKTSHHGAIGIIGSFVGVRRKFIKSILLAQPCLGLLEGSDAITAAAGRQIPRAASTGIGALPPIVLHDLIGIQIIHPLEGIHRNQNGTRGSVNNVAVVPQSQRVQYGRFVQMRQADQIVHSPDHGGIDLGGGRGNDAGFGIVPREPEGGGQIAQFDVVVVGGFEGGGIHSDGRREGLHVAKVIVVVREVERHVHLALTAGGGGGGGRGWAIGIIIAGIHRAGTAHDAAGIAIVPQCQLDHGLFHGRSIFVIRLGLNVFAIGNEGRNPSPLGAGGAEPDVGADFHFLKSGETKKRELLVAGGRR